MRNRNCNPEDSEVNFKFKKDKAKIALWIPSVVGVLIAFFLLRHMIDWSSKDVSSSADEINVLLDFGLAIISLTISTWTGISIANAIDRQEISNLSSAINLAEQKINLFFEDAKNRIAEVQSNSNAIYIEHFREALLDTINNPVSRFLYQSAKSSAAEGFNYRVALEIEEVYNQVVAEHSSKAFKNDMILALCRRGVTLLKSVHDNTENPLFEFYKALRYADFLFFRSYCAQGDEKRIGFTEAINSYKNAAKSLDISIPVFYNLSEQEIPAHSKSPYHNVELEIMFANVIGEAYSKIVQEAIRLKRSGIDTIKFDDVAMIYYSKASIFYCTCATMWASDSSDLSSNEVYWRNLGCAYERYDALVNSFGSHYVDIIDNYKYSLGKVLNWGGKHIPDSQIDSIFHVLLSYYERLIRFRMGYVPDFSDSFENYNDLKELLNPDNDKLNQDIVRYVDDFYALSQIASNRLPLVTMYYSMIGFSCNLIALCILRGLQMPCYYEPSPLYYTHSALQAAKKLSILGVDDDYSRRLNSSVALIESYIEREIMQV